MGAGQGAARSEALAAELLAAARAHRLRERRVAPRVAVRFEGEEAVTHRLVADAAARALARLVGEVADNGWSPVDLWERIRRRVGPAEVSLLLDTIASVELDSRRWRAHAERVDAQLWWSTDEPHLTQWAVAHGLRVEQAVPVVVAVLAELLWLPVLPSLDSGGTVAPPNGGVDPKILARVRALLAKAESTQFSEEADALSAKAQELMSRHAVERALVDAGENRPPVADTVRVWLDRPYVDAKSQLVTAIGRANRCRSVFFPGLGCVALVGDVLDLEITELLATSLLVQATRAMVAEGGRESGGTSRTRSFRRSFLLSYAVRIGERLSVASRAQNAVDERLLPVLAARSREVDRLFGELFTGTVRRSVSASDGEGWDAGRAAADRADLAIRKGELTA